MGLKRLLKLFGGTVDPDPPAELVLEVPGTGRGKVFRLRVATAGVSLADYLVHLNHALAEAVLTGIVEPGELRPAMSESLRLTESPVNGIPTNRA